MVILLLFLLIRYIELKKIKLNNELTLEKLHREKMEEFEKLRMRFFSNISHEFRTLLTLISGPLDLLQKNIDQEFLDKTFLFVLMSRQNAF